MRGRLVRRWVLRLSALVAGAVISAALLGAVPSVATAGTFGDVQGDEWYAEAVEALAAGGIVYGRQDGSFGPGDPVSRAQMAAFLARALHLADWPTATPFTDVMPGDWYFGVIGALYDEGLISGTTTATFSPYAPVSRQQATALVMRSLGYLLERLPQPGVDYALPDDQAAAWLAGFRDRMMVATDHAAYVANAYRLGVVAGSEEGWFYPALTLTRAQMAVMIYRGLLQPVTVQTAYPAEIAAESAYPTQATGSEGPLVAFLESRLTLLRYPCGPVDGVFDYRTRDAVMAFQKVDLGPAAGGVQTGCRGLRR